MVQFGTNNDTVLNLQIPKKITNNHRNTGLIVIPTQDMQQNCRFFLPLWSSMHDLVCGFVLFLALSFFLFSTDVKVISAADCCHVITVHCDL